MTKEIEIPSGYEARIDGNKVIIEKKESEDERIRNLIYCLIRDRSDNRKLLEHNGVSVDDALAYLEKQKIPKGSPTPDLMTMLVPNRYNEHQPAEWSEEDRVEGVPLTPEILEKNGFEPTPAPGERVWKHNGQEVWLDNEGKNFWANIKNGEFYFEGYIEHTHQLQLALRLCQIEKTIEL